MAMASKNKQINHVRDIVLNGRISSEVQCRLVKDILKYLLYHRDQIPLPFEQLKSVFEKQVKQLLVELENIKKGSEAKKLNQLLDSVTDVCDNLDLLFQQSAPLDSLLILLGPTVATPKEIFEIQFSNPLATGPLRDLPSVKLCSRILHKSLVTYNTLIDTNPPPITSLHILFQGQRSGSTQWFKPKHSFKVPKRGKYFTFHILSTEESSSGGQSPLPRMDTEERRGTDQGGEMERIGNTVSATREDLIWYAAPKTITGVKDTVLCIPQQGEMWVQ